MTSVCANSTYYYEEIPKEFNERYTHIMFLITIFATVIALQLTRNGIFDLIANLKNLFKFKSNKTGISLFDGIRCVLSLIIFFIHSVMIRFVYLIDSESGVESIRMFKRWKMTSLYFTLVFNIVDFFFVLSGIYFTKSVLTNIRKNKFNYFLWIFHRYIRLTPSVGFLLLFHRLLSYLYKNSSDCIDIVCYGAWWKSLLNIQNTHIDGLKICLPWTWYVAADFQMTLIAPFIIFLLLRYRKRAISVIIIWIIFISWYRTFVYLTIFKIDDDLLKLFSDISKPIEGFFNYASVVTRSPSYLIGVLFGFFIDEWKTNENKYKLHEIENTTQRLKKYFAIAVKLNLVLLPAVFLILNEFIEDHILMFSFESISKLSMSTAFGLFIAILHFGKFKSVNEFLSLKIWTLFANFSYCLFLVGPSIQILRTTENYTLENINVLKLITNFIMDLVISFPVAVLFFTCIEKPFFNLGKFFVVKLRLLSQ